MDRTRELISFTKNLYYLTKMGAPLIETLAKIRENISDKGLKSAVTDLVENMETGTSLTEAMKEHPGVFPPDYVKMIETAEKTQTLPQILSELATYLESVEMVNKNLRSAAFYPALVLNFCFIFIFLIYYFASEVIFNQYVNFIQVIGVPIGMLTWFFIESGRIIFSPLFMFIMLVLLICFDIIFFTKSAYSGSLFFKLPFVRDMFRKSYIVRISRALGFMLKQGITMDKALELVSKTSDSSLVKNVLLNAAEKVRQGRSLSGAFEGIKLFNSTFIFMIRQGEQTQNLPQALFDMADYFEDEIKMLHSNLFKFSEPIFIITVGMIVGFFIVSIFLPFYTITGAIK